MARRRKGWTQHEAAVRLGLSQSYVAMLESGSRPFSPSLARRARRVFKLSPTVLPPSRMMQTQPGKEPPQALAEDLAALGYPGFSYLRSRRWKKNPGEVLLTALAQDNLEARLAEALPWLLVRYWDTDANWLVEQAKLRDLQNRTGFVVTLARQWAERMPYDQKRAEALRELERKLEQSRLAREEAFGKGSFSPSELAWLRVNRPEEAKRWNLLTNWRVENLSYASQPNP